MCIIVIVQYTFVLTCVLTCAIECIQIAYVYVKSMSLYMAHVCTYVLIHALYMCIIL